MSKLRKRRERKRKRKANNGGSDFIVQGTVLVLQMAKPGTSLDLQKAPKENQTKDTKQKAHCLIEEKKKRETIKAQNTT